MVGFHRVVRVPLGDMPRRARRVADHLLVGRSTVGRDLDRHPAVSQCASEEDPCCGRVAAHGNEDIDHLAVLVDRAVQVAPATGDLDVRLVHEPPVTSSMPAGLAASMNSVVNVCTHRYTVT